MPRGGSRRNRGPIDPFAVYRPYDFFPNDQITSDHSPRVFFRIHLFRCPCGDPKFSWWESALAGAKDGEECDACHQVNLPYETIVKGRTTCQSPEERVFGSFVCHKCQRKWFSANSWSNMFQKCEACKIKIYPYAQDHLERGRKNKKKSHQTQFCEKCMLTGTNCSGRPNKRGPGRRHIRAPGQQSRRGQNKILDAIMAMGRLGL